MTAYRIILIFTAGLAAGFINVLAGGGSLMTVPLLMFLGLPGAVANGTNRIALIAQSFAATANFRRKGYFDLKFGLLAALPAAAGAVIGSSLAVRCPDELFKKIFTAVIIFFLFTMLLKRKTKKESLVEEIFSGGKKAVIAAVFFCAGIYGGFVQGGIGFIIIAALSALTGFSLIKINSVKVFVIAVYLVPAIAIFAMNGKVDWATGFVLAAGNSAGAILGSSAAVKKGDPFIKEILFVSLAAIAVKLFFF
ncbi:sulfite exporter TauE/SafE family protein [bacterium]|nr:sulfite exporter TauE/SafE family protein [bacterium]MBU3955352.1 sulfite exporter TauE/SafE family protein [bacterium]MBU4134465.1 sulfite exporter TauE/SafE family protein [bacterium]